MTDFVTFAAEGPVAWIMLNRPRYRNAQNSGLLYELDRAFGRFAANDDLKVAVLGGEGDHFSAGHDLGSPDVDYDVTFDRRTLWWDHVGKVGADRTLAREEEVYLGMYRRWRDLPKPTIAMVQGSCIAGGLKLAWACDLIVAADDARFSDPVGAMGVPGIEAFRHPWELGARHAKELLFTGQAFDAERALALGMVNRVVPRAELRAATTELAERISTMPRLGLALSKKAVHAAEDAMGQRVAMEAAFALHQVAHLQNEIESGNRVGGLGVSDLRKAIGADDG